MSNIRKYFTSRFPDGYLVELDYSQLEIYALAHLSGDHQLKNDLLSGADLHNISAEALFGSGFTKEQRRTAKQLSFQLQYGAGYKSMAAKNGVSEELAKKFIENYYNRYPSIREWQSENFIYISDTRQVSERRTKRGLPAAMSFLPTSTGRIYAFTEEDAPNWSKLAASFSPTKVKNYPVQGFATGDIVPMILGKLYRRLKECHDLDGKVLIVNTVHDSVVFDTENLELAKYWAKEAKRIMELAPHYLKEEFNIDFELPLPVGVSIGKNWADMEDIDI